jgi:hypothetical protein
MEGVQPNDRDETLARGILTPPTRKASETSDRGTVPIGGQILDCRSLSTTGVGARPINSSTLRYAIARDFRQLRAASLALLKRRRTHPLLSFLTLRPGAA